MKKIALVAAHEFLATVSTRAFILGLLATPAIIAVAAIVFPRVMTRSVQVQGEIAVIDPTAAVAPELRAALDGPRIVARRADKPTREALEAMTPRRGPAGLPRLPSAPFRIFNWWNDRPRRIRSRRKPGSPTIRSSRAIWRSW